jgi:hypothetical protein
MVSMRFASGLLPSEVRLAEVANRIAAMPAEEGEADLPLLAAYVAYQRGRMQEVRSMLGRAMQANWNDVQARLMYLVWLPGESLPEAPPTPQPDASQEGGATRGAGGQDAARDAR